MDPSLSVAMGSTSSWTTYWSKEQWLAANGMDPKDATNESMLLIGTSPHKPADFAVSDHYYTGRNVLTANMDSYYSFSSSSKEAAGIQATFAWICREGVCTGQALHNVKVHLDDFTLNILRGRSRGFGLGQLCPMVRRAIFGSVLLAKPVLLEPCYLVRVLLLRVQAAGGGGGQVRAQLTRHLQSAFDSCGALDVAWRSGGGGGGKGKCKGKGHLLCTARVPVS